jgi:hypothetical protein
MPTQNAASDVVLLPLETPVGSVQLAVTFEKLLPVSA